MHKYQLTVEYDHDCEKPEDAFEIVSFSNRHINFQDPRDFTSKGCSDCGGNGVQEASDGSYDECQACEGEGWIACNLIDHPDVLAVLSYYEHGQCKWMVGDSDVPDYGGFDTANVAGVIVHNEDFDPDLSWFHEKTDEEKAKVLDSVVEVYTAWANGDCYWYRLEEVKHCGECGQGTNEELDSCGGFIGVGNYFSDYINQEVLHGIDPADVKVTGEAEYAVTLDKVQIDPTVAA